VSCAAARAPAAAPARLFNRDFVLLWQGQLVSQLGSQAFMVAQVSWLMENTASATLVGLVMTCSTLPGVLLGPICGALADRHSRKAIIVTTDLARGAAAIALAATIALWPERSGVILAALFVVAVWSGVLGAAFNPAIIAAIPDLVPPARLQAANSLNQFSGQAATMLGQAIGGVAFRLLGAPLLFLADGLSYVLSGASEAFIRLPGPDEPEGSNELAPPPEGSAALRSRARSAAAETARRYLADTSVAFRYLWGWRGMRAFVLTATAVNFVFMPVFVLLPFYVSDVLGRPADWYGFLLAALSFGSLAGLVLAGSFTLRGTGRFRALASAFAGIMLLITALGLVRRPLLALAVIFGIGLLASLINVLFLTSVQLSTPSHMRGRVVGVVLAMAGAATPLGLAAGGMLADLTGRRAPATFVTAGLIGLAVVAFAITRTSFREFLTKTGAEPA
jgi:MFS family permease